MSHKRYTKRRHSNRSKGKQSFKDLAESELSSVTDMSKQFSPKGKSGLNSVDTKTIRKTASSLRNKSKGLLSMFGLNNFFGTKKNRRGKRVSFYII